MRGFSLSGLWCLDLQFAERMHALIQPRLSAGRDPIPESLRSPHPSAELPGGDNVPMAGTLSYYQYIAEAYTTGGICTISIVGSLSRYGMCNWGYEDLAGILQAAYASESVLAIVLRLDTPGGAVDGLRALADVIRARTKPVLAWTNYCASAGYFLASQCDEIWIEDQTLPVIGSVGTLMVYQDVSKALEKEGIQVTIFRAKASIDKALINGIEPLSDETLKEIQDMLDACQKEFAGYVRRGRNGLLKSDEWATGKMYGVRDAIRIGLADKTGTLQQTVSRALQLSKQSN